MVKIGAATSIYLAPRKSMRHLLTILVQLQSHSLHFKEALIKNSDACQRIGFFE